MNLLLKLIIETFAAFGNWLWAKSAPGAASNRLSLKRVLYLSAVIFLAAVLLRIGFADLAFIFAGDAALYFEVASIVIFVAARNYLPQTLYMFKRKIRVAAIGSTALIRRFGLAARERRNANALELKKSADRPKRSDDEPAAWIGGIRAIA